MVNDIITFTEAELGGLFGFDINSVELQDFLRNKNVMVQSVNRTIRRNLRKTITAGVLAGLGVEEIRREIRRLFNEQVTPFKELRIARTETAQTMSSVRQLIFIAEGASEVQWVTASDERVRPDHQLLGMTTARKVGHNYMNDLGQPGTLLYPTDPDGPPEQVINCRCVLVPVS
jgi:SPP1 gp7 family putative phage head morphogenesis protein